MFNNLKNYYKNIKKQNKETFKEKYSFEKRQQEAINIMNKYPNRIPVICERYLLNDPDIDRKKYLVPDDLSVSNFLYVIRKRIKLKPEEALYIFVNEKILTGSSFISHIYEDNKDKDGFLYVKYTMENTFG